MQIMLATFFLFIGISAEYVGNITLLPDKKVFTGLNCLSQSCNRNMDPLHLTVKLCHSSNCTNQTRIYSSRQAFFEYYREHNPLLALILTNNKTVINSSLPIFALPEKHSKSLLSNSAQELVIQYSFDFHCSEKVPMFIMKTFFLGLWIAITGLWVYNNYTLNSANSDLFHKFSTIVLIFKTLNLLAMFSSSVSCPIRSMMTREFLILFEKQTRSLYETSFFAYLLLLSKGWVLVVNSMNKKEFNYLIIVIIFIYILDSAVNIIGVQIIYFVYLLYLVVIVHVASFSVSGLKLLRDQIALIREAGMDLMLPVSKSKRNQFVMFLFLSFNYFLCEFFSHYFFRDVGELDFDKQSFSYFCHEIIELVPIAVIFFLYRARKPARYYSIELQSTFGFQRILPFYEAKTDCADGIMLAVNLPRGTLKLGKLV